VRVASLPVRMFTGSVANRMDWTCGWFAGLDAYRKKSGCFRTIECADNFYVIRSCLDTLHKQDHDMLEVLQRALAGNPIQPLCIDAEQSLNSYDIFDVD